MANPTNILWITMEDTSPRFGCTGDAIARTPHIDALAAAGRRYPLAFATAAVCAPSRFAVITGMYATAMGAHQMRTGQVRPHAPELPLPYAVVPPPYVRTVSEYLRAAGYYCTNDAKTDYQFDPPCTAWDECRRGAHWRHRGAGQPFFAVFNLDVTHESGMWPRPGRALETDPAAVRLPTYLPDSPPAREALARHYDNLAAADRRVGDILAQLDQDGLRADTAVFLWSDHGEGLPRGKRHPYDSGTRVPLIVACPGRVPAGEVAADALVSMIDLPPTVLALAGLAVPRHLQGRPFLGGAAAPRDYVHSGCDRHDEAPDMVRAVRDRRYRYIWNAHPGTPRLGWNPYRNRHPVMQELWRLHAEGALRPEQEALFAPRPPEELYDTEADPEELHNLAADPAHEGTLRRLRAALDAWRAECGDLGDVPEEQFAARMWPGGVQPRTATPRFVLLGPGHPGTEPVAGAVACAGPVLVQLYCATAGASIEYALGEGPSAPWRLYTEPMRPAAGRTVVRARAGRIGYADSAEAMVICAVGDRGPAPPDGGPELRERTEAGGGLGAEARLAAFLRSWAEGCADRLRRAGHAGTDGELAARHAEEAGAPVLARELPEAPGWSGAAAAVRAALAGGAREALRRWAADALDLGHLPAGPGAPGPGGGAGADPAAVVAEALERACEAAGGG